MKIDNFGGDFEIILDHQWNSGCVPPLVMCWIVDCRYRDHGFK